jgi:hypothetical protein
MTAPDSRPASRSWRRIHAGAPLKSEYRKIPGQADCADCAWTDAQAGESEAAASAFRARARDHAAIEHHRVTVHLAQEVILEPKHPETRLAAEVKRVHG